MSSKGLGMPEKLIASLFAGAFFRKKKKEHIVFFPYRPLTARHKFLLRLSRKPHSWTKIKKRKFHAFLQVNANKILTEVFSS